MYGNTDPVQNFYNVIYIYFYYTYSKAVYVSEISDLILSIV